MRKIALILFFMSFVFYAADVVKFSGSANLYGEYDAINGDTLMEPTSQVRFTISPTISFYEMPITFDLQLSSMESQARQALNKYRISIQPEKMARDMVNVPSIVIAISNVEFGTCYPYFSPYSLSGVPVSGGVVELNPGFLHLEGSMGKLQRSVDWSDTTYTDYAYARNLAAFNVGFGRKENSHFHFIYMHSGDDTTSVEPYFVPAYTDSDSVEIVRPMENYVVGVDLKLSFFENKFYIESEIMGTEVTRDVRMPELTDEEIPSFVTSLFHPRISSAFDFAFMVNSAIDFYDTEISGSVSMAGPGFESFGNPYMRNDFFAYEAGIRKDLWDNSMFLYGSLAREKDNLLGMKGSTTSFNSFEVGVGFNFTDLPYLDFAFSPYSEKNDTLGLDRTSKMFSVNTGYNMNLANISNYLNCYFSFQNYEDVEDANNYSAKAISVSDDINFVVPFTLSFAVDYSETSYPDMKDNIMTYDISAYYTSFEIWTNGIGFNFSSGSDDVGGNSIYLSSSLYMGALANMSVDIERNVYTGEFEYEDYDEWRIIGSISSSW